MKARKLLFFSRDPGGTNAIMPLVTPLGTAGDQVIVYGKDAALSIYRKQGIECRDICEALPAGSQADIEQLVQELQPDLIVTGTSSEDFTERHLWKAAEKSGIPTFAVLDQWTNYRLRLIPENGDPNGRETSDLILPSFMFVMDEFAKRELAALDIAPGRLVVSGQPFFDHIRSAGEGIAANAIEDLRRTLTGKQDGLVLVFASQPIASIHRMNGIPEDYWGYTEETVLQAVVECLSKVASETRHDVTLVIRLHPKDAPDAYRDALSTLPDSIKVIFDRAIDSNLLLKASDLIIGMFSMLLLEAAILGRAFISVQIGLKQPDPLVFARMGVVHSILTRQELEEALRNTINGESRVSSNLDFQFGATKRIIEYLEEFR